ncbi:MAG: TIGR02186 family protein [Rhodospirillales bacterium]|nr:TIGR02186 family protein [Rhodospirillales bacterium]
MAALSNHLVAVTAGFSGSDVLLFGAIDSAGDESSAASSGPSDIVVVVRGPDGLASVHRKGRSLGIWVNEAGMSFSGVPGFWAMATTRPIAEILPDTVADFHQLGLERLVFTPLENTSVRRAREFHDALVRTRMDEGLFAAMPGEIHFLGNRLFRTDLWIPANAPIGTYTVSVFLVRDHDVVSAETTPLVVGKVGLEARIYAFAHHQSFLYGMVAVIIAAMAGWLGNLAFRKG